MNKILLLSILASCTDNPNNYPPITDHPKLHGQVCLIRDLRHLDACSQLTSSSTIVLGDESATVGLDGSFTINDTGSDEYVVVGKDAITTMSSVDALVPLVAAAMFRNLLAANNVYAPAGTGSILTTSTDTVKAPGDEAAVLHSGTSLVVWDNPKGPVTLITGVPAGAVDLVFTAPDGYETLVETTVLDGGLTVLP